MLKYCAAAALTAALLTSASATAFAQGAPATPVQMVTPAVTNPTPANAKPRVVITADPELDDNNSMIRYLLRSTDFQTEGLIYASSQFHWTGDGKGTRAFFSRREYDKPGLTVCPCTSYRWAKGERFIDDAVDAYEKVYPNLKVHDASYPTPAELRSKIRMGNIEFEGDISKDTPGSDLIKSLIMDNNPAPLYIHAWGGGSTIARALLSIQLEHQRGPEWLAVRDKVIHKVVLHMSGDQDGTLNGYIRQHWPDIPIQSNAGGTGASYNSQLRLNAEQRVYLDPPWAQANLKKGPMGELVRTWGDGKRMVDGDIFDYFHLSGFTADELKAQGYQVWTPPAPKGTYIGEGDTGTYINLLDNGLRGFRPETYGGWGGYRRPPAPPVAAGVGTNTFGGGGGGGAPAGAPPALPPPNPFFIPFMNDFAGRLAWSVTPKFADANHYPQIAATGERTLTVAAGQKVSLPIAVSDPDKRDKVAVKWWPWAGASTYKGALAATGTPKAGEIAVPADAKAGDEIHVIAEATDNGKIPLTRYEHFVLTVR
jgi:hypothetical protein